MTVLLQTLLSLASVGFGWLLNERSGRRRESREDRRLLSSAVSVVLELRDYLVLKRRLRDNFAKKLHEPAYKHIPKQQFAEALGQALRISMGTVDVNILIGRFHAAVEGVTLVDPVLGWRLRGKELAFQGLASEILEIDPELWDGAIAELTKVVRDLAARHSRRTGKKVRELIARDEQRWNDALPTMDRWFGLLEQPNASKQVLPKEIPPGPTTEGLRLEQAAHPIQPSPRPQDDDD